MMNRWQKNNYGLRAVAIVLSVWAILLWIDVWLNAPEKFRFDDAWMFLRYAERVRHGLGLSWNLDGVPTYGMTTLLWQAVVLVGSFFASSSSRLLYGVSYVFSGIALIAIAFSVSRNARGPFRFVPYAFVPVALPLVYNPVFQFNSLNGMETMLATTLIAITVGCAIAQLRAASGINGSGWLTGIAAALAYLTRPESALASVTMLLLMTRWRDRQQRVSAYRALGVLFGVALITALCCKAYFGSYLPLSFYLKSQHAYRGYVLRWHPVWMAFQFLQMFVPFLVAAVLFCRRQDRRMVLAMLGSLAITIAYLCTVTQIMGGTVRYFLPYFPLCMIPALLVLDERVREGVSLRSIFGVPQVLAAGLIFALAVNTPRSVLDWLEWHAEPVLRYSPVQSAVADQRPLARMDYWDAIEGVVDLASVIPAGSTLAASEVGQLGYQTMDKNLIDLAGLNDTEIALHGFHPDAFLDRKADLIWLPHDDYTWQRGVLITAPKFLAEYDFYPGAYIYGIAIRKGSPYYERLTQHLNAVWSGYYPGTKAQDYLARSVSWDRQSSIPPVR